MVKYEKPGDEWENDIFADHAEWLAASARQWFRAREAKDARAIEVTRFYFENYLEKVLHRHLSLHDPAWSSAGRTWQTAHWFDGLNVEADFPAPGIMRLRGDSYWLIGQDRGFYDPFLFEIALSPTTGAFLRYVIRFGDSRPIDEKKKCDPPGTLVGGWTYEFEKQSSSRRESDL